MADNKHFKILTTPWFVTAKVTENSYLGFDWNNKSRRVEILPDDKGVAFKAQELTRELKNNGEEETLLIIVNGIILPFPLNSSIGENFNLVRTLYSGEIDDLKYQFKNILF